MQGTSIAARLRQLAAEEPDAPAVTCDGTTMSRSELVRAADDLAREMARLGVAVGDYVSIVLPNDRNHPVATVATWMLGAVPQPLSPKLATRELSEIVALTNPSVVIGITDPAVVGDRPAVAAGHVPSPAPAGAEPLPDAISPAWKAPTSGGSTGRPKIIRAGQPGLAEVVGPWGALTRYRAGTPALIPSPLSHNAGFMALAATLISGGHAVVMRRFEPEEMLRVIAELRVTWLLAVPTMMTRIIRLPDEVRSRYDVSSLEVVFHGAAPCPPETKEAWIKWLGPEKILEAYASTEGLGLTLIDGEEWLAHRGSVGRPLLGEIQIRDDDQVALPAGTVGRIWMRRPEGMPPTYHYIGAEPRIDAEGWETVGDMGRVDEDGYLYLSDRDGDLILVGGSNVYPAEIEIVLAEHPAVLDACVVARSDPDLGAVPHAVVHVARSVDEGELADFVAARLTPYKRPRSFEFTTEPIRDDAGKVRRDAWTAKERR